METKYQYVFISALVKRGNEENISHIVRDKHAKYLLFANSSFIKESKKIKKNKILFLVND